MTANSTLQSVAYVFQHMYDGALVDEAMRFHPTLDAIPKIADFGGDAIVYAIKLGNAQNITSGALTLAQAVGSSSKGIQFTMLRKKKLGTVSLDIEALEAARLKPGNAFAELVVTEVDGLMEEFTDRLGFDLFRDATGNRGQVASVVGNVITFVNPDDARNFKINMSISATQNADGTSPRAGSSTCTNVDPDAGTINVLSAASIISLSTNDFLFATPEVGGNIEGMEVAFPLTAPGASDSFRGQNRSIAPALLSGSRITNTADLPEETAGKLAAKIASNGGRCDRAAVNPTRWWEMARRLNAKIMYQQGGGNANYGFEKIMLAAPSAGGGTGGMLELVPDADCPTNRIRVYRNASHKIRSLKDFVHPADEDGLKGLRLASDDAIEFRVRSMSNYQPIAPRDFGVGAI